MCDSYRKDAAGGSVGAFLSTFESKDNETITYERFYYCKRYVASLSARFRTTDDLRELGAKLGYNPDLLAIWIEAHRDGKHGGNPAYSYFEPVFEKKKDRLHVRPAGGAIGRTRIR